MRKVETLTAYRCEFRYRQRNNPMIEQQREAIRKGIVPRYSFSAFIEKYKNFTQDLVIGENTDRAIALPNEHVIEREMEADIRKWHIIPNAGKQGKPIIVMKKSSGKKYDFGADSAALYEYHIFVYEKENEIIAIFHRQNGAGCKSVFLETANNAIKSEGLKLEMNLIVPMIDCVKDVVPTKVTLQFTKKEKSSDIADNMKSSKKKHVVRDFGLNLEEHENRKFLKIVKDMQSGKLNKIDAFAQIKAELKDTEDFNEAEIKIRIGNRYKKVQWNEFENIMGNYDITEALYKRYSQSKNYIEELTKLADEYYERIVKSEEV